MNNMHDYEERCEAELALFPNNYKTECYKYYPNGQNQQNNMYFTEFIVTKVSNFQIGRSR